MKRQLPLARDAEDRLQRLGSWKGGPDVEMETVLQSTPSSQIHQHAAEAARHGLGSSASPTGTSSLSAWLFSEERQVLRWEAPPKDFSPSGLWERDEKGLRYAVMRDCWRSTRPNRFVPLGLTRAAHQCFAGHFCGAAQRRSGLSRAACNLTTRPAASSSPPEYRRTPSV
jgi:hypothetical protein